MGCTNDGMSTAKVTDNASELAFLDELAGAADVQDDKADVATENAQQPSRKPDPSSILDTTSELAFLDQLAGVDPSAEAQADVGAHPNCRPAGQAHVHDRC